MTAQDEMEATYGPLYRFSDHKRGDRITYNTFEASGKITRSGEILWVQGPGEIAGRPVGMRYIVEPDLDEHPSFVDIVFPSDILEDAQHPTPQEPTLERCPYCGNMHEVGTIEQCPLKPPRRE